METKELRIGNIVKGPSVEFQIISPKQLDYAFELQPIPLTEDWLLKFGFSQDNSEPESWYEKGTISISFFDDRMCQELKYSYNQFDIPKHVHQLQNLYFALTGEELTIKA